MDSLFRAQFYYVKTQLAFIKSQWENFAQTRRVLMSLHLSAAKLLAFCLFEPEVTGLVNYSLFHSVNLLLLEHFLNKISTGMKLKVNYVQINICNIFYKIALSLMAKDFFQCSQFCASIMIYFVSGSGFYCRFRASSYLCQRTS